MQLTYDKKLRSLARTLRKARNLSEVLLWNQLKKRKIAGLDFHRQKPIGQYIVDFYCPKLTLIIEIDGKSHADKIEYDAIRMAYFKSLNLSVLVFTAEAVKQQMPSVLSEIEALVDSAV